MALPPFNADGDLPVGVYRASLEEVRLRFSAGSSKRQIVADRMARIWKAAKETGQLDRMVLFGSFITTKPEPNDVDVVLVMKDTFDHKLCSATTASLFDHRRAELEWGASVFWIRPGLLLGEPVDRFITGWQIKRDGTKRGIV